MALWWRPWLESNSHSSQSESGRKVFTWYTMLGRSHIGSVSQAGIQYMQSYTYFESRTNRLLTLGCFPEGVSMLLHFMILYHWQVAASVTVHAAAAAAFV